MALRFCTDVSLADWIVASELPWSRLVCFGPSKFGAYGRLRFLPDPVFESQTENEADREHAPSASEQWRALFELLASHTGTREDCYFGLWEGWPLPDSVRQLPVFGVPRHARFPARRYFLFNGPLVDACDWGDDFYVHPESFWEAAFVWPADHAWCVANDVDPHWAGIGANANVIDQLLLDARLDVVAADPSQVQPNYA
jgi:hypothetical protein